MSVNAVKFLVDNGLDVNETVQVDGCEWYRRALLHKFMWSHHYAFYGPSAESKQIIEIILRAGADPMEISEDESFEALVSFQNSAEVLETMFEISGELIDLNHKNRFSRSALSEACYELSTHSPDVLDFLLSRGADPLGPGTSGGTCLNTAVQTLGEGAFDKESSSDFFVILMRAIAEAQATKDQNKLVSREELYGLNVLDDDKHTPLSRAKTLCFIRRKIFHAALVECGFYIDLFPPGEECPNFTPGDRRVLCFLYSDLDSIYQSRIDSGGEKSQDGVSANDACEGAAFERGGTDGSLWLSNTDELARRSLPGFQLTFNTGRDEHWDDQVMQSPSHQPTVLTHPSSNPQDDITGVVTLAADSTPSTSTPNLSLPGIRELFRVSDVGRLQATSWDDPLRHDRYTDRYITTPPSVTPNRRFSSQDFSFQANIPASESFALLRIWIDPSTANALQENVWSTPMELHPDAELKASEPDGIQPQL